MNALIFLRSSLLKNQKDYFYGIEFNENKNFHKPINLNMSIAIEKLLRTMQKRQFNKGSTYIGIAPEIASKMERT